MREKMRIIGEILHKQVGAKYKVHVQEIQRRRELQIKEDSQIDFLFDSESRRKRQKIVNEANYVNKKFPRDVALRGVENEEFYKWERITHEVWGLEMRNIKVFDGISSTDIK